MKKVRVYIRPLKSCDCAAFLTAMAASVRLHRSWVCPPRTKRAFDRLLTRSEGDQFDTQLICLAGADDIVGAVTISNIVRGGFHSAYLGYYAVAGHARKGLMTQGMRLVLRHAFKGLKLHRVEANIQPDNLASIALVRRCGFHREGFSPRYLKIAGRWRDHERWALLREHWEAQGPL